MQKQNACQQLRYALLKAGYFDLKHWAKEKGYNYQTAHSAWLRFCKAPNKRHNNKHGTCSISSKIVADLQALINAHSSTHEGFKNAA